MRNNHDYTNDEMADELALFHCCQTGLAKIRKAVDEMADELDRRRDAYAALSSIGGDGRHMYAVVADDDITYGVSGGVLGLYDTKPQAESVAQLLRQSRGRDNDRDRNWCGRRYFVIEMEVNASPRYQIGWQYIE